MVWVGCGLRSDFRIWVWVWVLDVGMCFGLGLERGLRVGLNENIRPNAFGKHEG